MSLIKLANEVEEIIEEERQPMDLVKLHAVMGGLTGTALGAAHALREDNKITNSLYAIPVPGKGARIIPEYEEARKVLMDARGKLGKRNALLVSGAALGGTALGAGVGAGLKAYRNRRTGAAENEVEG